MAGPKTTSRSLRSLRLDLVRNLLISCVCSYLEILVLGTGKTVVPLPPSLRDYLHDLGIQVDPMSTRNAAATFNLLAEENRRVAAALLPVEKTSARTGEPAP